MAAKDDETLAMVLAQQDSENSIKKLRGELAAQKKNGSGLPTIVNGVITIGVGGAIGLAEGIQHGGDQAKKDAQSGYLPMAGVVVGTGLAIGAGANMPRARALGVDVAVGSGTVLAYQQGEKEGVQIALQQSKERALAQQKANGALPAGQGAQPPAAPAQGVQGWRTNKA